MEQVIISDRQTQRLAFMWWALAVHVLLITFGEWIPPFSGICGLLSRLLIPVELVILLSSLDFKRPYTACGLILSLTQAAVILYMYLYMGKGIITKELYFDSYSILPYSYCALLFLPLLPLLRSFLQVNYMLSIIGCFIAFVPIVFYTNNGIIQFIFETCIFGAGFIFISGKYHTQKHLLWASACLFVGLLAATVTGRRNLMLTVMLYLFIGGVQFVFGNRIKSSADRFLLLASLVVMMMLAGFFYLANSRGLFSVITARATENTRDYVFLNFALDMDLKSLLVGRGMNGTYYCPGVAGGDENRNVIENGYLQVILNGGLLYLVSYLSIFIYSIVKGFKACNQMLHTCAWMLVVQLIDMATFGLHAFNVKTYMLWMAVALCLDRTLWRKNDEEIKSLLMQPELSLPRWEEPHKS